MPKIYIRNLFNRKWNEVTREQARRFANVILSGATNLSYEGKLAYINSRLKGVTAEELLDGGEQE